MDKEKISALVDGEVSEDVSDQLSLRDVHLCNEYQLIGDLVRAAEAPRLLSADFARKMASRLAEEPSHGIPASQTETPPPLTTGTPS